MTHVHEDLGAYVLGGLDADTESHVRAHLAECEDCRVAHAELSGLPALLDLAAVAGSSEEDPLPPAIEERLLDRFARERAPAAERPRWRPRIALGLGGALAGAAVAAAVLLVMLGFERAPARPGAQYRLAFQPTSAAPMAARARASLRTVPGGTVVRLWVYNLNASPGDTYEVLCDAKTWSASAGTFRVDSKGYAYVILTTAAQRGQYDAIRVVRRSRGPDGKLSQAEVLGAKLA
jgi:Putative zinc-finger